MREMFGENWEFLDDMTERLINLIKFLDRLEKTGISEISGILEVIQTPEYWDMSRSLDIMLRIIIYHF